MDRPRAKDHVEITGVRTAPSGDVDLVELEAKGGGRRIAFGQRVDHAGVAMHGLAVDGRPVVLVTSEGAPLVLALVPTVAPPLPTVDREGALTAVGARDALAPLLPCFADGLYSISRRALPPPVRLPPHALREPSVPLVVDTGPIAHDSGTPVVADLAGGVYALLSGRAALRGGAPALVVSASFLIEASGFERRRHDRAARERFARQPSHVFDEARVRDAVFAHATRHKDADLGVLAIAEVEPAWRVAHDVARELAEAAEVDELRGPERAHDGRVVEYRLGVEVGGARFIVSLRSDDGRRVHEATVRRGGAYRATGLKPTARAIARCLREIVREEAV